MKDGEFFFPINDKAREEFRKAVLDAASTWPLPNLAFKQYDGIPEGELAPIAPGINVEAYGKVFGGKSMTPMWMQAATCTPAVQNPDACLTLHPCTETTKWYRSKMSRRKRLALKKKLDKGFNPNKYLTRALKDLRDSGRLHKMSMKETNPIRKQYLLHIAELKSKRANMWAQMMGKERRK